MRAKMWEVVFVAVLMSLACYPALAGHVTGQVTQVSDDVVRVDFPVPVHTGSMLTILAGEGNDVAGIAAVKKCEGDRPPYRVTGRIYLTMNPEKLAAGKQAYVQSVNAGPAPSSAAASTMAVSARPPGPSRPDLGMYYYAANQKVGYGLLGLGYERTVKLSRGLGVEIDGGVTGLGNVDSDDAGSVSADQLVKSLSGTLRFDLTRDIGVYSSYRWNEGRGDEDSWNSVTGDLGGKEFDAPSSASAGRVEARGLEYGLSLRPLSWLGVSAGYVPSYRIDYGSIGVRSRPAYTAELRFGKSSGAARLRGIYSDGYWSGDLGVTIR